MNENTVATAGCLAAGTAWIIGIILHIVFWVCVIAGVIWGLKHFGVIG